MAPTTVRQWIDRWEATGLVGPELAEHLRADARSTTGQAPEAGRVPTVEHVLSRARTGLVETLGYLGAALTLGTAVVLLDVPSWDDAAIVVLLLVVAAVGATGTFRLTPATGGRARRLAGVLGATAVTATFTALHLALGGWCGGACDTGDLLQNLALTGLTALVAAVMYLRHRHLLTHATVGAATFGLVLAAGMLVFPDDASHEARDMTVGVLLLVVSTAWMWASETGRLEPAWLGTLAAGGITYLATVMATSWDPFFGTDDDHATIAAALGVAAIHTLVGVIGSRVRVTIVGVAGLLVTVPWMFTEVFGWTPTQTALLLLPVGIALTTWAVTAARGDLHHVE